MVAPPSAPSGRPILERILAYGASDTGKTKSILDIAKKYAETDTPGTFWYIDHDMTLDASIAPGSGYEDLENVQPLFVDEFGDWLTNVREIKANAEPDVDWVVVDTVGALWAEAQDKFIEDVMPQESLGDFWKDMRMRGELDSGSPHDGYKDWQVINRMYREVFTPIYKSRFHVYATAFEDGVKRASKSGKSQEAPEIMQLYSKIGYKPVGQKHLGHAFHTVLRFEEKEILRAQKKHPWIMTSVRQRGGRARVKAAANRNFYTSYLFKVGGWR